MSEIGNETCWVTIETAPQVHVMPSDNGGKPYTWHIPSPWCECNPTPGTSPTEGAGVWVHHDDH